jgi:hypothetical protein
VGKRTRGGGNAVKLEEFAKIRHAFLYEPIIIHSSPKALWTPEEDGGSYERAFGVEGEIQDVWSKLTLNESLLALALYFRIWEDCKTLAAKDKKLAFMQRLKFHALSLAGAFVRANLEPSEYESTFRRTSHFDDLYRGFWPLARQSLVNFFASAETDRVTLFALVRSVDRWNSLSRNFELQVAAAIE